MIHSSLFKYQGIPLNREALKCLNIMPETYGQHQIRDDSIVCTNTGNFPTSRNIQENQQALHLMNRPGRHHPVRTEPALNQSGTGRQPAGCGGDYGQAIPNGLKIKECITSFFLHII